MLDLLGTEGATVRLGARGRGGIAAMLCAATLVVGALPIAASSAGASGRAAVHRWIQRGTFSPTPQILAGVACPTTSLCLAVGSSYLGTSFILRSADGGATWQEEPTPVGTSQLTAVSCGSPTMCIAVADNVYGTGQIIATTDGGLHWASQDVDPATFASSFGSVSCESASVCMATGSGEFNQGIALLTTDGGTTWTSVAPFGTDISFFLEDGVCFSATSCLVVGEGGGGIGVAVMTTDAGLTWHSGTLPAGAQAVYGLSCVDSTTCTAVGQMGSGDALLHTTDGGATWTSIPVATVANPNQVSCRASGACIAVGFNAIGSTDSGWAATSTDGGATWTPIALPLDSGFVGAVGCATDTSCVLLGQGTGRQAQIFTWTAGTVTEDAQRVGLGLIGVSAIACVTVTSCDAVGSVATTAGQRAAVLHTTSAGVQWSAARAIPGAATLSAVACPTPSVCVAVGSSQFQNARIVSTTDAGGTWHVRALASSALDAVACPSALTCVTVGQDAHYSMDRGVSWRTATLPHSVWYLASLACPSTTLCIAVGQSQSQGGVTVRSVDGGRTWTTARSPRSTQMSSVSCATSGWCVAVGSDFSLASGTIGVVELSTDRGASWHVAAGALAGYPASSISCTPSRRCVAVESLPDSGAVAQSTDGGRTWTTEPTLAGLTGLTAVTCGSSGCWAIGEDRVGDTALLAER